MGGLDGGSVPGDQVVEAEGRGGRSRRPGAKRGLAPPRRRRRRSSRRPAGRSGPPAPPDRRRSRQARSDAAGGPSRARCPAPGGSRPARCSSRARATRLRSLGWIRSATSGSSSACIAAGPSSATCVLDEPADLRRDRWLQVELGQRRPHVETGAADDDRRPPRRHERVDLRPRELRETAGAELLGRRLRPRPGGARAAPARPRRRPRSGPRGRGRPGSRRRRRRPDPPRDRGAARRARSPPRSCRRRSARRSRSRPRRPQRTRESRTSAAEQRLRGGRCDLDLDELAGGGGALEVHCLVVAAAATQACRDRSGSDLRRAPRRSARRTARRARARAAGRPRRAVPSAPS